jgi:hypothetical protein
MAEGSFVHSAQLIVAHLPVADKADSWEAVSVASALVEVAEIAGTETVEGDSIDLGVVEGSQMEEEQQVAQDILRYGWDDLSLRRLRDVNAYRAAGPFADRPNSDSYVHSCCRNSTDRYKAMDCVGPEREGH